MIVRACLNECWLVLEFASAVFSELDAKMFAVCLHLVTDLVACQVNCCAAQAMLLCLRGLALGTTSRTYSSTERSLSGNNHIVEKACAILAQIPKSSGCL